MNIQETMQSVASPVTFATAQSTGAGESAPKPSSTPLSTHVAVAAALGNGIVAFAVWGCQLAHVVPPAEVVAGFATVASVLASWILQKLGQ